MRPSFEFCSLWIFPWIKLSWHSCSVQTNLGDSIDSGNFSVRGYLPLVQNDSSTHMQFMWRNEVLLQRDLSLENSADSYLCFWLALLHSVFYLFFLYQSPFSSWYTVFYSISSNIDEVLTINPSANVFVFGYFNVHHKEWLTYSGGTDRLVNSAIIFLSQVTLLRWLTFLLRSQTLILTVLHFWIWFFLLTLLFVMQWLSLHWEILIMLLSQFPLTSTKFTVRCSFHCIAYDYSCADWDGQRSSMGGYL